MKRMLVLLICCTICNVVIAQTSSNRGRNTADENRPSFEQLDKDRDGRISQDEARASAEVAARFASADKNGDSHLSRAEFQAQFNRQE